MIYYTHHLGDYMRDTAHLSMLEDAAYRRLLDIYYIKEIPLPSDVRECCKLARAQSKQEREAVAYVLRAFFTLTDDGYRQTRADIEIGEYQAKREKAKRSANARWNKDESDSECNANDDANAMRTHMRTHCEGNANQYPITNNQINTPPTPPVGDGRFDRFWKAYPRKVGKDAARRMFVRRKVDEALLAQMLTAIAEQAATEQWRKDGGHYIPNPATWLNAGRWQDEVTQADAAPSLKPGTDEYFAYHQRHSTWWSEAGFATVWDAANERCYHHNASQFRDGKKCEVAA